MPESFTRDQLVDKALSALIDVMERHKEHPCKEPELLRFALAFLYDGGDREPFDTFYREAMRPFIPNEAAEFGRFQSMRSAYGAIAARHGRDYW